MCCEGEKKMQRKRGSEVLVDSLLRQFMHYEDGGGSKPSTILQDQGAGIVGSTRFTPEFVRKYPNMMNGKGFKLLTDGDEVWMKKAFVV